MKKAILFLYIFCAFLQFSIAQISPLDSSLVHPLRVLGERSSSADPYVQQNNTGIENKSVQELKDAAMALVGVIPANIAADFKVYDYAAYAMVGQMKDPDKQNEKVFNAMDSIIRTVYNVQSYFLIGKEINATDGKVKFRVKLNLPLSGNKPNLDDDKSTGGRSATIFDEINEELLTELNTEILSITNSKNTSTSVDSKKQEKVALKATKYYLTGDRLRAKKVEVPKESENWASGITPDNKAIMQLPYNILPDKHTFVYIITPNSFTIRALAIYKEENNEKTKVHEYKWENGEFVDAFDDGVSFAPLNVTILDNATYAQAWQFDNNDNCFLRTQYIKFSQGSKPNSVAEIKDKVIDSAWEYSLQYTANKTCLAEFVSKVTGPVECFGNGTEFDNQKAALENFFTIVQINGQNKIVVKDHYIKNKYAVVRIVNKSCKSAIKSLLKEKMLALFECIATSDGLPEEYELALLRIMSCLETVDEYKGFYTLLEKIYIPIKNTTVLQNLVSHLHDASIDIFFDQPNYTNFIKGLVYMYKTLPQAYSDRFATMPQEQMNILASSLSFQQEKGKLGMQSVFYGKYENGLMDIYEEAILTTMQLPNAKEATKEVSVSNTISDEKCFLESAL